MAYRLKPRETIAHGLRRLANKALRSARDGLRQSSPPTDAAIFAARKSLKKVRTIRDLIAVRGAVEGPRGLRFRTATARREPVSARAQTQGHCPQRADIRALARWVRASCPPCVESLAARAQEGARRTVADEGGV